MEKEIKKSLVVYYFFFILYLNPISAQDSWIKSINNPIFEVGDLIISNEGNLFVSAKNSHYIFFSKDSGSNWTELSLEIPEKFLSSINNKYFKQIENKVYCGWCSGSCTRLVYEDGGFRRIPGFSFNYNNLKFDHDGNIFVIGTKGVYNVNSYWQVNSSDVLISFNNSSIVASFFIQ